jgi:protein TonB
MLLTLVLIPLLCPQALPHQCCNILLTVPTLEPQPQPEQQNTETARPATETLDGHFVAPRQIPQIIKYVDGPEPPLILNPATWVSNTATPGGDLFKQGVTVVHPAVTAPIRVSTAVEEGLLILKTMPVYPPIARAAHVEGTVMLAATISKNGTIKNLRVTSGHGMLRQAALDAVSTWRYRPYLLDGQPVEVETTVNVIFTLGR